MAGNPMVADNPETFADLDGHETTGTNCDANTSVDCAGKPITDQKPKTPPPQNSGNATDKTAKPQEQQKPPSWTKDKPLPDDPSKLGPDWHPDPKHDPEGKSGDKRYVNDKTADKIDWHKGVPGQPGEGAKDHWHWVPGGKKDKEHYHPGDNIKRQILGGISVGATGYIIYRLIRMLPSLIPGAWETIPLNFVTP
jgi:hypothetical protein